MVSSMKTFLPRPSVEHNINHPDADRCAATRVAIGVLGIVVIIALALTFHAADELHSGGLAPPVASYMLLALVGLAANLTTAYLFRDPAETRWSFRAALAHELADGALTIAGLI